MKITLLFTLLLWIGTTYSQDSLQSKKIDSLVKVINNSNIKPNQDSITENHPEFGLSMKTYLTMILDNNQLKKYVNHVTSVRVENAVSKKMVTSNTFYYDQNKLIKVEEFEIEGDKEQHLDWYFLDDKWLNNTFQMQKFESRASQLLSLSKVLVNQIAKKVN
jgi:hypothetical protein